VISFVTLFYGNGGTKFPDKIEAVGKLAGSYEYTNTSGAKRTAFSNLKLEPAVGFEPTTC
jgi:hypothetical protein